jgi:hypothetical protein
MAGITKDQLVLDWLELNSITKIADKYGVAKNTIIYYFKKLNIPYITKTVNYGVDDSFFLKDSEESFYWAGFLAADGCIVSRKDYKSKILELELGEKDLDHLLKFKDQIKSNHPIKEKIVKNKKKNKKWSDRKTYRIRICNYELCSSLERFNIVSKKTKTYDFPKWLIDHSLVNHFMRGYFDGDGCISKNSAPNRKDDYRMNIAANKNFLITFSNIICKNLDIINNSIILNKTNKMYYLCYSGNLLVNKVCSYLYNDAKIFLKRKHNLWQKCIEL